MLTQKTGITHQQARDAIQVVTGYITGKLPPSMASQVDDLISGQSQVTMSNAEDLAKGVGDVFKQG